MAMKRVTNNSKLLVPFSCLNSPRLSVAYSSQRRFNHGGRLETHFILRASAALQFGHSASFHFVPGTRSQSQSTVTCSILLVSCLLPR